MKIGIIGAMESETKAIKELVSDKKITKKVKLEFVEGKLCDKDVVVVTCGIGKVNAAMCTQIIIDKFNVDYIINVGIAGGLTDYIYPLDIVISDEVIQHDMDVTYFNYKLGQVPGYDKRGFRCDDYLVKIAKKATEKIEGIKSYTGVIVTGDQFLYDLEKQKNLSKEFNALATEMEGASIGQVAFNNNIKFIVIRAISDNAVNDTHFPDDTTINKAIKNSITVIEYLLNEL